MTDFLQATAAVLLTGIICVVLRGQARETALILSVLICCCVGCLAFTYIRPVIDFIQTLQQSASIDSQMLQILMKIVGISLIAELADLVCSDSGNASMGKMLQFMAVGVILWLSLPMLTTLLDLVEEILQQV